MNFTDDNGVVSLHRVIWHLAQDLGLNYQISEYHRVKAEKI